MSLKPKILLVEDERIIAIDLKKMLEKQGYQVPRIVSESNEAIRALSEEQFQLVLMDIRLQGDMDGIDLTRLIRSSFSIPIIYVTAHVDNNTVERAKSTAPYGYITKPIDEILLGITIEMALGKYALEQRVFDNERRLREFADLLPQIVFEMDDKGTVVFINRHAHKVLRVEEDYFKKGAKVQDFIPWEHSRKYRKDMIYVFRGNKFEGREYTIIRKDNTRFAALVSCTPVFEQEKVVGLRAIITDISEQKSKESQLRNLFQAVEQSPSSVVITDHEGKIEYVNRKFQQVTGYTLEEVRGQNPNLLKSGILPRKVYRELWDTILAGADWQGEFCNKKKTGELFWEYATISPIKSTEGIITHFLAQSEDITIRKEYEERFLRQANYDELTGLPNRVLFFDRLAQAIASGRREGGMVVIMFMDLDNLKNINDTMGREVGDLVLVETAKRLERGVRKGDTVARHIGDEFLVIIQNLKEVNLAEIAAERILSEIAEPFLVNGRELYLSASLGMTIFPNDGAEPLILLQNADAAMHQAKDQGGNRFRFFTAEMNRRMVERLRLDTNLRQALKKKELYLYYQPIIDLSSLKIVGAEALLRWRNPELGLMPPDKFIPFAEESGLIIPIGDWVLYTACKEASRWNRELAANIFVAVNVSSRQFTGPELLDAINFSLTANSLAPEFLELEITERILMVDKVQVLEVLNQIKERGVRLSLDDFGTGYSSLSYLKKFPFHILKIDRVFINEVTSNPDDEALVRAIVSLSQSLNLRVISEGIETREQLDFLARISCDMAQGYYFCKPLPVEEFFEFLQKIKKNDFIFRKEMI
jgi:diguanylate cyclase (GGDEF)-like protein/PAS domain S-box-containing protein